MEGRRVSRRAPRRNPLYVLFMGLCAAVVVLLIVVIVLAFRLHAANAALEKLQNPTQQLDIPSDTDPQEPQEPDGSLPGDDTPAADPAGADAPQTPPAGEQSAQTKVGWLDLTGHSEVSVAPKSVFDQYYTYYATNGVNLRSGPGTSYDRVKLLDLGTQVKAAAKDGAWTFVSVDGKFGWVSSDYLSTTKPEVQQPVQSAPTQSTPAQSADTPAQNTDTPVSQPEPDVDNTMPEWLKY